MRSSPQQNFIDYAHQAVQLLTEDPEMQSEYTKESLVTVRQSIATLLKTNPILRAKGPQDVGTPDEFLAAVRQVFGTPYFDLAASKQNHVTKHYYTPEHDALSPTTKWPHFKPTWGSHPAGHRVFQRWLWLNPPYSNIQSWVERCVMEKQRGRSIMVLIPASVGSRWWSEYVEAHAYVLPLIPRMRFKGYAQTNARDLAFLLYSDEWSPQKAFLPGMDVKELGLSPAVAKIARRGNSKVAYLGPWEWNYFTKRIKYVDE